MDKTAPAVKVAGKFDGLASAEDVSIDRAIEARWGEVRRALLDEGGRQGRRSEEVV